MQIHITCINTHGVSQVWTFALALPLACEMARCRRCGVRFENALQLGAHNRMCAHNIVAPLTESDSDNDASVEFDIATLVVTQPEPLHTLARREPRPWGREVTTVPPRLAVPPAPRARDYRHLQQFWHEHVKEVHACCSSDFWKLFGSLQGQTISVKDKVMHQVKKLMQRHFNPGHLWPTSCRGLRTRVERRAGNFWSNVTITYAIDLADYNLPGCTSVQFHCLDPVYVWIAQCNRLTEAHIPVHFHPARLFHPDTGEEVFGAGLLDVFLLDIDADIYIYIYGLRIRAHMIYVDVLFRLHVYVYIWLT